jgi:hypothetical protein
MDEQKEHSAHNEATKKLLPDNGPDFGTSE